MQKTLIFLLWLAPFMSVTANAENLVYTFSASGASTAIDSINVTNLTTNENISIPGVVKLELIDKNSSIAKLQDPAIITVYPNPYQNSTKILFDSDNPQSVRLLVTSLSGKVLLTSGLQVLQGSQIFNLSCQDKGVYIVSLMSDTRSSSVKVIQQYNGNSLSLKNNQNTTDYGFSGHAVVANTTSGANIEISTNANSNFMYYSKNDILLFRFYSGIYKTFVTVTANATTTINAEFVSCVDKDNYSYPVVKIGKQTWMAENLHSTTYINGDKIPENIPDSVWVKLDKTKMGASAYYLNNAKYVPNFGLLYNWYAANDSRGICPTGWHVSSNAEWDTLLNYLGGAEVAGGKLKITGANLGQQPNLNSYLWKEPNAGATNSSGFSAVPSSGRNLDGVAYNHGHDCFYWMADEMNDTMAYNRYIHYSRPLVTKVYHTKRDGFAVRCIKD